MDQLVSLLALHHRLLSHVAVNVVVRETVFEMYTISSEAVCLCGVVFEGQGKG